MTYLDLNGKDINQEKALTQANADRNKGDHLAYSNRIRQIFQLDPLPDSFSEKEKNYLAGFIEGEGSINISIKKNHNAKFGITIDPEFSITQHVNGVNMLFLALNHFQTGRIRFKEGSNATLVFIISNRDSLTEKVVPFLEEHTIPFASKFKVKKLALFKEFFKNFEEKNHLDLELLQNKVLPIWDEMRMQKGQKNQTFPNLESAKKYARDFKK